MTHLTVNVKIFMLIVLMLLSIASLICYSLKKINPAKDYTELYLRIRSWWIMIGLLFGVIIVSTKLAIIFFAFISYLALKEFLSLIPTRRSDRRVLFWAYLSIPIQYYLVYIHWYIMFLVFIPVYMFLLLPFRMVLIGDTKGFLQSLGTIYWGLMICVFSLSHLAYLLVLDPSKNPAGLGPGLLIFIIFLTQFNDISQYVCGKLLGKHKIIPKVSPNKTVEGFVGGIIVTLIFCIVLSRFLTPLNLYQSILMGLIVSCFGFIGDVTISAIKRDLGVKDTSNFIPGHGGILDRLDSLTYTGPLFFHILSYFYY